jgi:hypothetical protein
MLQMQHRCCVVFVCRCCCAFFCDALVLDCSIEWINEEWVDSQVFQ